MFVRVDNIEYFVRLTEANQCVDTIVMLHGFGGTGEVFNDMTNILLDAGISTVLIDLPGHGLTKSSLDPKIFNMQAQVYHLLELLETLNLESPWLYGYSMGGRIASRMAVDTSYRLSGVILESAQLGILDESDRVKRAASDRELAEKLRENPSTFFEVWNRLPLFSSGSVSKNESTLKFEFIQWTQKPDFLALSLEYMSPGLIPPISPDQLEHLPYPVLVITGKLDKKYDTNWVDIASKHKAIDHVRIPKAGHRIHLDQPELLSKELIHYIKSKHKIN